MKLVEDHGGKARQPDLCLFVPTQPFQDHARCGEENPGRRSGPVVVANRIADLFSQLTALEFGHPGGQAPTGHPARLDHQHPTVRRTPPRHLGRLSRAGWRGKHHRLVAHGPEELLTQLVDRQLQFHGPGGRPSDPVIGGQARSGR